MVEIRIERNDSNQRLDKFLKKYLKRASLSYIYKLIRKDVKVNGKRGKIDTLLLEGDIINLYLSREEVDKMCKKKENVKATKQFRIAYEDEEMLIVEKPFGLLTHGDKSEKKNTLANQVIAYLVSTGAYSPRIEKTFVPSPVNRLDRNTTGLVIFGKTADSVKRLNKALRERDAIKKYYLTIVAGEMKEAIKLVDKMEKNNESNTVQIVNKDDDGKVMETIARPIEYKNGYTLVEVELLTGRTHQIRVQLGKAGYPIIGDIKYGSQKVNRTVNKKYSLTTQLLHAYKLVFEDKEVVGEIPINFEEIKESIFRKVK